jgi:hypothetical protein
MAISTRLRAHGVDALFNALLYTGLAGRAGRAGRARRGDARRGQPGVAKPTIALGVVVLAAGAAVLAGVTPLAPVGLFAVAGFHVVAGRRLVRIAGLDPVTVARRSAGRWGREPSPSPVRLLPLAGGTNEGHANTP